MSTAISIRNLTKAFPGGAGNAVDGISLDIAPGEVFFLLGPSGCGKTTLLRMIAGFIEPTAGSILFNGRDMTDVGPSARNTGMVFQSYALWPHMTVSQNVAFGLDVRGIKGDAAAARVREALEFVKMSEFGQRRPTQLSGGQQQRVALARALVIRPDVLLLDEPLSNLDAKLRNELRSEIRRICVSADITTIYVTHDQKEALSMADRMAVLNSGRAAAIGAPRDLYKLPPTRFVAEFLGEANVLTAAEVLAAPSGVRVRGSFGELHSAHHDRGQVKHWCVRPECWSIGGSERAITGTVEASVFLGEAAQHQVRLADGTHVLVVEVNPSVRREPGAAIQISAAPEDVVPLMEGRSPFHVKQGPLSFT